METDGGLWQTAWFKILSLVLSFVSAEEEIDDHTIFLVGLQYANGTRRV